MKKAVGVEAEEARRKGIKNLMVPDTDYEWSLYNCKNSCNQNK